MDSEDVTFLCSVQICHTCAIVSINNYHFYNQVHDIMVKLNIFRNYIHLKKMGIGDGSMAQPRKLLTTFMDGGYIFSFDREGCQVMIEGTGNRECRALCKLKTPFVDLRKGVCAL